MTPPVVVGVLLAAGAGRRAGGPKALRRHADGTSWLQRSTEAQLDGGCSSVIIVLGAAAEQARTMIDTADHRVHPVVAADWADGMGASLRAGLAAVDPGVAAACVHLVDLPDVGSEVITRVLRQAGPDALARATYAGRPGHPVLIGRDHLGPLAATLTGDEGGRGYLRAHSVQAISCEDLATGADHDLAEPQRA